MPLRGVLEFGPLTSTLGRKRASKTLVDGSVSGGSDLEVSFRPEFSTQEGRSEAVKLSTLQGPAERDRASRTLTITDTDFLHDFQVGYASGFETVSAVGLYRRQ